MVQHRRVDQVRWRSGPPPTNGEMWETRETPPRRTKAERHDHHHVLISERVAAFRSTPRRSGLDKIRRREAYKKAAWTLRVHLSGEHGLAGRIPVRETLAEMLARHDALHADGS